MIFRQSLVNYCGGQFTCYVTTSFEHFKSFIKCMHCTVKVARLTVKASDNCDFFHKRNRLRSLLNEPKLMFTGGKHSV